MSRSSKGGDQQSTEEAGCEVSATDPLAAPEAKRGRSPSPKKCREFIRRQTANAMPAIVNTFVKEAKDGSVSHFNALAKVGGFDQRAGAAEAPKRRRKSLAQQLLDEVEKYEAKQAEEIAARQVASDVDNRASQERS